MSGLSQLVGLPGLTWDHPWALLLLLLCPLLVWLVAGLRLSGPRIVLPSALPLRGVRPSFWARLHWLPSTLLALALACAAVGLAGPRLRRGARVSLSVEGIDIVVALDLSTSMLAADFTPKDRISVAKEVLSRFVASRPDDRLGLVVFASEAYTQCPLTLDHRALEQLLSNVRIGVIPDGTAIGNALGTAVNRLRDSDARSKVIILLTDGDNNAGNLSPLQAARLARDAGIRVYPILIGTRGKVPYPARTDAFGRVEYEQVEIDIDPELLQDIARITHGAYYNATDGATLETGLAQVLDHLEKSKLYESSGAQDSDQVGWALFAPAAMLGLFSLGLRTGRQRGAA